MSTTSSTVELQSDVESHYSRLQLEDQLRESIEGCQEAQERISAGIVYVTEFMEKEFFESKAARIAQLKHLNLATLVRDVFVATAYCQTPELFTTISAQLAGRLGFTDRVEGIQTAAELLAVLCQTDAYDIVKADRGASLVIESRIPLSAAVLESIKRSQYLPPMVCVPRPLEHNFQSGYLTHDDSLILGKGNDHGGDICRPVLDTCNRVALRLDPEFLAQVEEEPTYDLNTAEKVDQWQVFKTQSAGFYQLMQDLGNRFHLTHKVDKRGRIYAQGYHITTQGTSYKKAMLELADPEFVTGVPTS